MTLGAMCCPATFGRIKGQCTLCPAAQSLTQPRDVAQADTLQSQLIQAQQEAGDAKTTADTSIAELQEALKDAVARQQEPAVRLSNPQASRRC